MYWVISPRLGTGWTSESTHRTAMRSAAGTRSCMWVSVLANSSVFLGFILRLARCQVDRNVDPVEVGRVTPAQLFALFGGQRLRQLCDVATLPMRIAGPEHHHVFLAGEAKPLTGELGVARTIEAALDEVHVFGDVGAGNLRCPRRLFQVRPAEGVHPPHERRKEVGRTVGPDELHTGKALEHALGDHVHQVIHVIQRHEAHVLLVGQGVPRRCRGEPDPLARLDVHRGPVHLVALPRFPEPGSTVEKGSLVAPMPGNVIRLGAAVGAPVTAGQPLIWLEAMKMEHTITAPTDGVLAELDVNTG